MPTTEAGVHPQQENQPKRGDDGCPFHEGALFGQPTRLAPKQEGHDEQAEENPGLGVKQAPLCAPQEVGHDSGSRDQAQNSPKIGNVLGAGISKHFMIPYNERLWGVSPSEITAAWCSRFVPLPN